MSTNGHYVFQFEGVTYHYWVRQLVDNLVRLFPELQPKKLKRAMPHKQYHCSRPDVHGGNGCKWEPQTVYRIRLHKLVAKRWTHGEVGVSAGSLPGWMSNNARPGPDQTPFLADLRQFGRVEFRQDGTPIKSTFGKGPDYTEFRRTTPPRTLMRRINEQKANTRVIAESSALASANP